MDRDLEKTARRCKKSESNRKVREGGGALAACRPSASQLSGRQAAQLSAVSQLSCLLLRVRCLGVHGALAANICDDHAVLLPWVARMVVCTDAPGSASACWHHHQQWRSPNFRTRRHPRHPCGCSWVFCCEPICVHPHRPISRNGMSAAHIHATSGRGRGQHRRGRRQQRQQQCHCDCTSSSRPWACYGASGNRARGNPSYNVPHRPDPSCSRAAPITDAARCCHRGQRGCAARCKHRPACPAAAQYRCLHAQPHHGQHAARPPGILH